MSAEKPFAPACERNQAVILDTLKLWLRPSDRRVLEVGSGTGQHAVYFGKHLPDVEWQTSDVPSNHSGIQQWLDEASLRNVKAPVHYEIGQDVWPTAADCVFTANTIHIIAEALVERLIQDMGQNLNPGNRVMIYGPFKYGGQYTSESNAEFDQWLKERDTNSGIRDFNTLDQWMLAQDLHLIQDISMPANNQMLIYEKS